MSQRSAYHVPERFLRQLWKHQSFSKTNLRTTDDRAVEILFPGEPNLNGGPDFSNASIRIGEVLFRGHVELHQHDEEWNAHNHHSDPKYNSVVLHVVFRTTTAMSPLTKSKRSIPVLVLENYLTSTYRLTWEKMILDERAERLSTIKCYSINGDVEPTLIRSWLEKLAIERMELKVRRFEERLKELVDESRLVIKEPPPRYDEIPFGLNPEELPSPAQQYSTSDFRKPQLWDQLVYEGMMEALGYSKNRDPFLTLAKNLRLDFMNAILRSDKIPDEEQILTLEALLFGVAGLIPPLRGLNDHESKDRVRLLTRIWKIQRKLYHGKHLLSAHWQFFRLHPENFPTLRLAGAARLIPKLLQKSVLKFIIQTIKSTEKENKEKFTVLEQLFTTHAEEFWTNHYRFGELAKHSVKTLIGKSRADDIVLNVVIPICLLYARVFRDRDARQGSIQMFEQCPPLSENTVTTTIADQLIKGKMKLDSAMLQQGTLQLYKFYCMEERCAECTVGKKVFTF